MTKSMFAFEKGLETKCSLVYRLKNVEYGIVDTEHKISVFGNNKQETKSLSAYVSSFNKVYITEKDLQERMQMWLFRVKDSGLYEILTMPYMKSIKTNDSMRDKKIMEYNPELKVKKRVKVKLHGSRKGESFGNIVGRPEQT